MNIIKLLNILDEKGLYKKADKLDNIIRTAAWPYNLTSLDELPLSARFYSFKNNENDFKEFDRKFFKELQMRIPDYFKLRTSPEEENNIEGLMHGPDSVPGPAYIDPENPASSPSMNGSLDYFEWDEARYEGTEYWKNLLPRR